MTVVLIRSIILYITVLIALRVMGKGEIAEMNCFDLVITLLIAEVASVPMENNNIPIINGVANIWTCNHADSNFILIIKKQKIKFIFIR